MGERIHSAGFENLIVRRSIGGLMGGPAHLFGIRLLRRDGRNEGLDLRIPEHADRLAANNAAEILVERVEGVRLQFAEDPSEALFDAVDHMEEGAAVYLQLAAAQAPVSAQKKVVLEDCVLYLVESAPADQTEVGDEFLLFAGVDSPAFASPAEL